MKTKELLEGLKSSKSRALAKAITYAESSLEEDQQKVFELFSMLPTSAKPTLRIGISGVPGAGKSTFIEAIGKYFLNEGYRLAVLAIDPSSVLQGGSILGDKTRMPFLASHKDCFVRPTPSRGQLGGGARHSREAIRLCEAAGYDIVIVETVGVGQSEVEIKSMVDLFLSLHLPNSGDELQALKKGILEVSDFIVVNKADGDLRHFAKIALSQLKESSGHSGKTVDKKFFAVSARDNLGIEELFQEILHTWKSLEKDNKIYNARRVQLQNWLKEELKFLSLQWLETQLEKNNFSYSKLDYPSHYHAGEAAKQIFSQLIK